MSHTFLVTGGAGFIGSNYVYRLLKREEDVIVFDNFSRKGAQKNVQWLQEEFGEKSFQMIIGDIRDEEAIKRAAVNASVIVHLAGQVAVTSSVMDPRYDYENNALGTFNVLEAARLSNNFPLVIFSSTNKVYGGMEEIKVIEVETRYCYADFPFGISEQMPLDFHSPYGCSKGSGDQYVRDYYRIYNIPTVVMRQSCIYGPRQFGIEDQGWVAWFIIAAVLDRPITIYGDGKQIRDTLFIDDLLNAYDLIVSHGESVAGQIFNIGGGHKNTISIWKEFGMFLENIIGRKIKVIHRDWRPGDQRIYVSDIRKAEKLLGWSPKVNVEDGINRLYRWVVENKEIFEEKV